ncbi:MAG: class I adenylate-forming enzyme family protein [Actinomycetota bacterium]
MTTFWGPPLSEDPDTGALTLGGFLRESVAANGPREAVVAYNANGRLSWTYADLEGAARAIARALIAAGVEPGERVALLMGNRPSWVASAFGVALAGGVLVPVNTYLEARELAYVLSHSDAALLLMQTELAGHDYVSGISSLTASGDLPALRAAACVGLDEPRGEIEPWSAFLGRGNDVPDEAVDSRANAVSPDDDGIIIYTSGTTAAPKGVLHTHAPPCMQSRRFVRHLALDGDVRSWSAFPLFWTAGFAMVMGATLACGGCLVLQERFEPGEALRLLATERVTTPHAWPHQLGELEEHPDWADADLSAMRHIESFGPFGRHPSVKVVEDAWTSRAAFGLTETFTIVTSTPADAPREIRDKATGRILPGNAIRILDPATDGALPVGEPGEIAVAGASLMKGYVKVLREQTFDADGFFHTGDAGWMDENGFLHWTGRTSDMIKTGGANVSPVEIEMELLHHPKLKAAGAVGVPHPTLGQIVVVVAVPNEHSDVDEEDVRGFLKGRIASYKIPRRVVLVREEELTLTGNQKIKPEDLRALATARLARSSD